MFKMKAIDIHAHVNFATFDKDRDKIIKMSLEAGVGMINIGTQRGTSLSALELAQKHKDGVYAAVGLHPVHTFSSYHDAEELGGLGKGFTSRSENFDYPYYKKLAADPKVVAIGECGLDYFHLDDGSGMPEGWPDALTGDSIRRQKEIFEAQVCLAEEINKPLMLHIRDPRPTIGQNGLPSQMSAYQDVLTILDKHPKARGNVHFFAGDWAIARRFLERGFTLSFTGVITFTRHYDDIIKRLPLGLIMAETDAPYVAPTPHRGRRNKPLYVLEVLKRLAEIKGVSTQEVARQTLANARRLFGLNVA
ncbi:MAG: TatD family hydrolase [Patescibacteria group bacterium]|nr:TatD family hydrolase [Patescibacteria group bacterium]